MRFDRLFSLDWETLAEQMSDLPKADARHLSSFFDHLLSDVVCQQLLPEAAKSFSRAFSISFSFKPRIAVNRDLSSCRADIAVDISHPMFPNAYLVYESGSPIFSAEDGRLRLHAIRPASPVHAAAVCHARHFQLTQS